jgi:hypothetical protein
MAGRSVVVSCRTYRGFGRCFLRASRGRGLFGSPEQEPGGERCRNAESGGHEGAALEACGLGDSADGSLAAGSPRELC